MVHTFSILVKPSYIVVFLDFSTSLCPFLSFPVPKGKHGWRGVPRPGTSVALLVVGRGLDIPFLVWENHRNHRNMWENLGKFPYNFGGHFGILSLKKSSNSAFF